MNSPDVDKKYITSLNINDQGASIYLGRFQTVNLEHVALDPGAEYTQL